jgi:hypothetical protein
MPDKLDMEKKEAEQQILEERDEKFIENWHKEQREAHPQIYRAAEIRRQQLADQELERAPRPASMEPGHDPTLQAEYLGDKKLREEIAETAGTDNIPPHEGTPENAATSRAVPADAAVIEEAEAVEEPKEESKEAEEPKKATARK